MATPARNAEFRAIVVVYTFCLVVGQIVKPRLSGIPITFIDLLIAGTLPIIAMRLRARPLVFGAIALFCLPNIALGVVYLAGGAIDGAQLLMGLYSVYRFLFPILLIFCYGQSLSQFDRSFAVRVLLWGVAFHIVFGIIQAATLPNFALRYGPQDLTWDYQENRLVSTFLDPNLMSGLFYATALALLAFAARGGVQLKARFVGIIVGSALAAALTASRGGTVAFALTFIVLLFGSPGLSIAAKLKWSFVTVLATILVLFTFVQFFGADFIERTDRFGASNVSVAARVTNLAVVGFTFLENPIFGLGFNFLPYLPAVDFVMVSGNYADGGLLYLLASVGVFGFVAVIVILYFAAKSFMEPRLILYPAMFLVVQSATTSSMFYPLLTVFVTLFALGLDGRALSVPARVPAPLTEPVKP